MSDIENLRQFRSYASEIRGCVNGLNPAAASAPLADALAARAAELVTEADQPLRIGVVGEFSSGKSLLLGVLLGDACLLPTSPQPTTGNVTELRFAQQSGNGGDSRTRVQAATIRYFRPQDLDDLNRRMLTELSAAVQWSGAADALREASASGTAALTDWCEKAWPSADPATRKLIRELLQTRVAAEASPAVLGAASEVDPAAIRDVLQIPYPATADNFSSILTPGYGAARPGGASHLVRTFPLIDRVILDLDVPAEVWDLARVRDRSEFVLLDFPGVGGGLTPVRDLFLTQRGLRDVHTVLVMVDSAKPGGQAADSFYGFLQKLAAAPPAPAETEPLASRMLYCATRFDLLKPPTAAEIDVTGGPDGAELTEQALLALSVPLRALLDSGHRPGGSSMSAMLSSVTAIQTAGLTPVPADLDLEHHAENAMSRARRWREIGDGLKAGSTGRDLATALQEYAGDGGIGRLRRLLERHIAEHGLKQRVARLRELATAVEEAKAGLMTSLSFNAGAGQQAPDDPAVRADRLLTSLTQFRRHYETRVLPQLRDPSMVFLQPGRSLQDDVAQYAAELVIEWPQWADILSCVRDSVIVIPEPYREDDDDFEEFDGFEDDGPRIHRPERQIPQTAADFLTIYADTCGELRGYSRERTIEAVERWLGLRTQDAAELRHRADGLLSPEARERLKAPGGPFSKVLNRIDYLLAPQRYFDPLKQLITRPPGSAGGAGTGQQGHNGLPAEDANQPAMTGQPAGPSGFPLRHDQVLPWSAEAPGDAATRHVVRMLRIRSAFIASATEYALEDLEGLQDSIYRRLDRHIKAQGAQLPEGRQREAFIAVVTGEAPGSRRRMPPQHVATLEAIRPPVADDFWED